ncbi:hypothetical protein P7A58_15545, partial [Clostridium perfringens]|nr:hypothetical protein [Clostridium perfringens]
IVTLPGNHIASADQLICQAKQRLYRIGSVAKLLANIDGSDLDIEDCDLQNIGHLIGENLVQVQNDLDHAAIAINHSPL